MFALMYEYFNAVVEHDPSERKTNRWYHFISFILIFIAFSLYYFFHLFNEHSLHLLFFIILIFASIIYAYFEYHLLNTKLWGLKKKLFFENIKTLTLLKKWTIFIFLCKLILAIRVIIMFLKELFLDNYCYKNNLHLTEPLNLAVSSLVFLSIFIALLSTPEITYGIEYFQKSIKKHKEECFKLDTIWILKNDTEITNINDKKIEEGIQLRLKDYIVKIEEQAFMTDYFLSPKMDFPKFSKVTGIPVFHLKFIFKYHAHLSFSEFKNIIRIKEAVRLIENDYLKLNTIESLAYKTGFNSYMPFYNSFKTITKKNPQDYWKEYLKNNNPS